MSRGGVNERRKVSQVVGIANNLCNGRFKRDLSMWFLWRFAFRHHPCMVQRDIVMHQLGGLNVGVFISAQVFDERLEINFMFLKARRVTLSMILISQVISTFAYT